MPQLIYLFAISQSDGSACSTLRMRNDRFQRNSSSTNNIDSVFKMQTSTAQNHAFHKPLCVNFGPYASSRIVEIDGS